MRSLRRLAIAGFIAALLSPPSSALAATITPASCGRDDVAAAVSSASDGDTIQLPAGRCTWTTNLTINKRLTIQGAGIDKTTIVDGASKGVFPNIPQILLWNAPEGGLSRLTGITFQGGTIDDPYNKGMVVIAGPSRTIRLDNLRVVPTQTHGISIYAAAGVVDHCQFDLNAGHGYGLYIQNGGSYGDASWAAPDSFGTDNAFFVEDSSFTFDNSSTTGRWYFASDGWMGSRVVFRNNVFTNTVWANHGTESGGRWRSMRQHEVYNNTFSLTNGASVASLVGSRGGTGVVFNNTATLTGGAYIHRFSDLVYYRATGVFSPWGQMTGSNVWDGNADASGYPGIDQPGRGQGGLLSGYDATPVGWPRQVLSPVYAWNNLVNGVVSKLVSNTPTVIMENRDFYNSVKPGYSPYQYPHPLVSSTGSTAPAPSPTPTPVPALSPPTNLQVR